MISANFAEAPSRPNTPEICEIASVFPGINKSQGLNSAIIGGRMKSFDQQIDGAYRSVLGQSYDTVKTKYGNKSNPSAQSASNPNDVDAIVNEFYNRNR